MSKIRTKWVLTALLLVFCTAFSVLTLSCGNAKSTDADGYKKISIRCGTEEVELDKTDRESLVKSLEAFYDNYDYVPTSGLPYRVLISYKEGSKAPDLEKYGYCRLCDEADNNRVYLCFTALDEISGSELLEIAENENVEAVSYLIDVLTFNGDGHEMFE